MKIAVDMRMSGKSGIGTFFDELLPYFKESQHEFYFSNPNVKTFSIKEMFFFPKEELEKTSKFEEILKKIKSGEIETTSVT